MNSSYKPFQEKIVQFITSQANSDTVLMWPVSLPEGSARDALGRIIKPEPPDATSPTGLAISPNCERNYTLCKSVERWCGGGLMN